jgi:hypothetical protein
MQTYWGIFWEPIGKLKELDGTPWKPFGNLVGIQICLEIKFGIISKNK